MTQTRRGRFESDRVHVGILSLDYRQTKARALFKGRSGHTTQHLLTLLVGLDSVRAGAKPTSSLPASWNPVSQEDAAARARVFALSTALVWTVESVVSYVKDLTRAIPETLDTSLIAKIRNEKDKETKLVLLVKHLSIQEADALTLLRAGYVWRNRLTHYDSTNQVSADVKTQLEGSPQSMKDGYQGLDTAQLLERIEQGETPRLKETAAIIRAASTLVRSIDQRVTETKGTLDYLRAGLAQYLQHAKPGTPRKKAAGLWGGTEAQNRRSLENFGTQMSLSRVIDACRDDEGLALLTPQEAVELLLPDA